MPRTIDFSMCLAFGWLTALSPLFGQSYSSSEALKINRWAVISDSHMQTTGLPDLLTAQLTQRGIELVERDQLAKVVDEHSLALLAGGDVRERLKIGRLLQADALIVLRQTTDPANAGQLRFHIILCECRQGARLGTFSHRANVSERIVKQISRVVVDRATQFSNGLQRIVAVAPFACLNAGHEYDSQAQSFFEVLTNQLLTLDGVAVLEVEEARQLAKEFGGRDADKRRVPLFISPSFQVNFRPAVQFDLHMEIRAGTKSQKLSVENQSLTESLSWLRGELMQELKRTLEQAESDIPLHVQQGLLAERADLLEDLGDMARAMECRETYLLADSQNVRHRLAILRHLKLTEYRFTTRRMSSEKERQAVFTSMMNRERGLDHLSFLIRANLISRTRALEELKSIRQIASGALHHDAALFARADPTTKAYWDASLASDKTFILGTAAKILDLKDPEPLTDAELSAQNSLWYRLVMENVSYTMAAHAGDETSFRYFVRVVNEVVPESLPTSSSAAACLERNFQQYILPAEPTAPGITPPDQEIIGPTPETVADYLRRMKQSKHKHLRWYATLHEHRDAIGAYFRNLNSNNRQPNPVPDTDWLDPLIEELQADPQRLQRDKFGAFVDCVLHSAVGIKQKLAAAESPQPKPEPTQPPRPKLELANDWQEFQLDRLQIHRLTLPMPKDDLVQWLAVDKQVDVRFGSKSIHVMREPGRWKEIAQVNKLSTGCWDGLHLWYSAPGEDITILDLTGKVVQSISAQHGLPSHFHAIQVYPLGRNRVLAYGSEGREHSAWIALVTNLDNRPQVIVLHETSRKVGNVVVDKELYKHFDADPRMRFEPTWMTHVHDDLRDLVYMGRLGYKPLRIDMKTKKTTVSDAFGSSHHHGCMVYSLPHLFKAHNMGVAHLLLPANTDSLQMIDETMITRAPTNPWSDRYSILFEQGDWFIKPGVIWHRFHKDGTHIEQLVSQPLPNNFHDLKYWQTAHYGIVSSEAFQFIIKP